MKRFIIYILIILIVVSPFSVINAESGLLTIEENAWLSSRDNTLNVVPERNNPPVSFSDQSWETQGIFIDFIDLVAKKVGANVNYISARTRIDVIDALKKEKVDYIANFGIEKAKELGFISTTPYFTIPIVIAVRQDYDVGKGMTLDNFNNRQVAILAGSSIVGYVGRNYPKVVLKEVIDNELALQKLILAEVDAVVINFTALQYYLSTKNLVNIKVAGSISGLDIQLAFVVPKDQAILRSILEKGLLQVSPQEHEDIIKKWQIDPEKDNKKNTATSSFSGVNDNLSDILMFIIIFLIILLAYAFLRRKHVHLLSRYTRKINKVKELEEEMANLENTSEGLMEDLNEIKTLEKEIKEKIKKIDN